MVVRIWGCRGSLTTSGRDVVRYGGYTTCLEVRLRDGTVVIIDAGSGIHKLGKSLLAEVGLTDLYLLLTHSHWDHLTGFPFFGPAYLARFRIHVRGGPEAKQSLANYLRHQMDPPYFPVEFDRLRAGFDFSTGDERELSIGPATIIPVPLSHPNGGYGYKIVEDGKAFVFLTDNEPRFPHPGCLQPEEYTAISREADLLLHDAQYTDEEYATTTRGWGHSSYTAAMDAAIAAGAKRFGTFHHDPDHADTEIDRSIALCKGILKKKRLTLECFAAAEGQTLTV